MADYLKSMAARATGQTSASVRPKIPSLFEPPPALLSAHLIPFRTQSADSPLESSAVVEASQPSLHIAPGPRIPGEKQDRVRRARRPEHEPEVQPSVEPVNITASPRPSVLPGTAATAEPVASATIPVPTPRHQDTDRTEPRVGSAQSEETPRPPLQTPHRTSDDVALQHQPRQPNTVDETAVVAQPRHRAREVVNEVVERVRHKETVAQPLPAIERAEAAHSNSQPQVHSYWPAAPVRDTRPVINVTIGRVVVDTVTEKASAPSRTTKAAGPVLSLDRYLEQRRGRS